jgi:hypothetical protein
VALSLSTPPSHKLHGAGGAIFDHKGVAVIMFRLKNAFTWAALRSCVVRGPQSRIGRLKVGVAKRRLLKVPRVVKRVRRLGYMGRRMHVIMPVKTVSKGPEGPVAHNGDGGNGG